jgi:hypothetical protein
VAGACVPTLEEPAYVDHPEGIGLYVDADRLADGRPVLAYHDRTRGLARLAIHDGAAWQTHNLEGDAYHDIGLYISMTVDASADEIHLSFTDAVEDDLIYFVADTSGATVLREIIDDGIRADGRHVVGLDSVIFLDGGTPTVLYQDGTTADLWIAARNGADDWTTAALREGDPGHGFFVDAAIDTDGTLWVAEYIYDWSADPINRLEAFVLQ